MKTSTEAFVVRSHPEHDAVVPDPADDTIARINSVIPWITKRAHQLRARLNPREQAMVGIDDLLQAAWLELLEKDHYFDPNRSKYVTFQPF